MSHQPRYNCAVCGQARAHVDAEGLCAWCRLTVILTRDNPALPAHREAG